MTEFRIFDPDQLHGIAVCWCSLWHLGKARHFEDNTATTNRPEMKSTGSLFHAVAALVDKRSGDILAPPLLGSNVKRIKWGDERQNLTRCNQSVRVER